MSETVTAVVNTELIMLLAPIQEYAAPGHRRATGRRYIRQMTPFISEAVLKRVPSLPKQHALVFGTSVNLPTTFRVRDAKPIPMSDDAKIRELWFHENERAIAINI